MPFHRPEVSAAGGPARRAMGDWAGWAGPPGRRLLGHSAAGADGGRLCIPVRPCVETTFDRWNGGWMGPGLGGRGPKILRCGTSASHLKWSILSYSGQTKGKNLGFIASIARPIRLPCLSLYTK